MNRYSYNMSNPNIMPPGVLPERTMPMMCMPCQVSNVDPFVVDALMCLIGKKIVVDTVRGAINGILKDVKPDHIVIHEVCGDSMIFIRIEEIVSIMPISRK